MRYLRFTLAALCATTFSPGGLAVAESPTTTTTTPTQSGPLLVTSTGSTTSTVAFWLGSSLKRVFPDSDPGKSRTLEVVTPRNAKASFQACLRNLDGTQRIVCECKLTGADELKTRVRRVGYVPLWHLTVETDPSELEAGPGHGAPGLVPDPLFPDTVCNVGPNESQSFWITIDVPANARPGKHDLNVEMLFDGGKQHAKLTAVIDVRPLVLGNGRKFPVTHWWTPHSIMMWYKTGGFSERWWELARAYVRDMVEHRSTMVQVPLFQSRREYVEPIPQLLRIRTTAMDKYVFDFTDVKRFVDMAKECGIEYFEWSHLWIYWGVRHPVRIYGNGADGRGELIIPTDAPATTGTYRLFLEQFLPEFHKFLLQEGIVDTSYFHVSDEPGGDEMFENYKRARLLLRELAPWMKVMDAISEVRYGKAGLTEYPVPILHTAHDYVEAGIPHWVYYCCGPRGPWLNRFFDTPLAKIRMSGMLFYRFKAEGFLHWGYNYWSRMEKLELIDPFTEGSSADWPGIPYGDPFVVYPGENGPLNSIRWEVFAESLQDHEILRAAGVKPDDPLLAPLKSYADFPKNAEWIDSTIRKVLDRK